MGRFRPSGRPSSCKTCGHDLESTASGTRRVGLWNQAPPPATLQRRDEGAQGVNVWADLGHLAVVQNPPKVVLCSPIRMSEYVGFATSAKLSEPLRSPACPAMA